FFIGMNTNRSQATRLTEFVFDELKSKRAILIRDVSEAYSTFLANDIKAVFTSSGGRITRSYDIVRNHALEPAIVEEIVASEEKVIFMPLYAADAARIMLSLSNAGARNISFIGADSWEQYDAPLRSIFTNMPQHSSAFWTVVRDVLKD